VLFQLPELQRAAQTSFDRTGGQHAAALFSRTGELRALEEDVGRHNAVDKITGAALLSGNWPLDDAILLLSGRASFELIQKALAARIPMVCSIGAPSSLAVSLAASAGITLCGFLRSHRANVYTHPERLGLTAIAVAD
jgi:FdhD protein